MILAEFSAQFIESNSLIRLWYKIKGGHEMVKPGVSMEWKIEKGEGHYGEYANHEVLGVTDIVVHGTPHPEAINIVIKRI
jgi:hypothetical protein